MPNVTTVKSSRWVAGYNGTPIQRWVRRVLLPTSPDGCWEWIGAKYPLGYGAFSLNGRPVGAHRYSYQRFVGEIPVGLQIDHLCRNPACCNPSHLEAVTQRENLARGEGIGAKYARRTHCREGHSLSGENLIIRSDGSRVCRTCYNAWQRMNHKRKKAASCRT